MSGLFHSSRSTLEIVVRKRNQKGEKRLGENLQGRSLRFSEITGKRRVRTYLQQSYTKTQSRSLVE